MLDEAQQARRGGTVTVLALLVSLLLGYGGTASAAEINSRAARLGQSDAAKASLAVRTAPRSHSEAEEDVLALPAPPLPTTHIVLLRSVSDSFAAAERAERLFPAHLYRARAPPAA